MAIDADGTATIARLILFKKTAADTECILAPVFSCRKDGTTKSGCTRILLELAVANRQIRILVIDNGAAGKCSDIVFKDAIANADGFAMVGGNAHGSSSGRVALVVAKMTIIDRDIPTVSLRDEDGSTAIATAVIGKMAIRYLRSACVR